MENEDDRGAEQFDNGTVSETCVNNLLPELFPQDGRGKDNDLRVVSVVSKEATGKTAGARSVYGRVDVKRWFAYRAWVCVQNNFSVWLILGNILRQISTRNLEDIDQADEAELSMRLHEYCFKQRYLVVLDNINRVDHMATLLSFLIDSGNGSRVIITTRNVNLPYLIDPWVNPIEFHPLTGKDRELLLSWWIKSEPDQQVSPARLGLMQRIVSWYGLSPAGIQLLDGLLTVTRESKQFEARIGRLAEQENLSVEDILSLCYDELHPSLRSCIMYICQFPREYEIPTRRLLRQWLAESLIPAPKNGIQYAENCFKELVGRNMIHVVSQSKGYVFPKTCRMPGFIYDFLLQKALGMGFFETYSNPNPTHISDKQLKFNAPRIVVHKARVIKRRGQSSETQKRSYCCYNVNQVRSFISFNTKKTWMKKPELDIFLKPKGRRSSLEVLDLEGVYKPVLPKNPGYFLLNLKYLGLRWTILDELPKYIGDLPQLETLDVKHTNITEVPSSIWTKKSLRHLYLSEVSFDKSIPHRWKLSQCSKLPMANNLQTLCGLHIKDRSPMLNVLQKLTDIRKLSLTCPSTLTTEVIKHISGMTALQSLRLKSKDMLGQPSKLSLEGMSALISLSNLYFLGSLQDDSLSSLPKNLKSVTLSMSFLTTDQMNKLENLEHLTDLRLYGHSYGGTTLKFAQPKFPLLRTPKIWKLANLNSLIVEEGAMPCLEEIDIRDCQQLTEIHVSGNRTALKEISLAKVKQELEGNLQATHLRPIITATELIPSATTTEGLPAK